GSQSQRPRERSEDLHAGLRTPLLFETRVVVGRHGGELCDFLAAKTGSAAARSRTETHVRRLQLLPAPHEELGQCFSIHHCSISRSTPCIQGPRIPGWTVSGEGPPE